MQSMLFGLLALSFPVFNYNGVYAQSIQRLDEPIKAISSGEFGLPQDLHVQLHSRFPMHGREAEAMVLGIYSGSLEDRQTTAVESSRISRRGLWSFIWAATKVFINPMSWTNIGMKLGDLTCQALGWWSSAPSWVSYLCNSFGVVSTMFSVWDGRGDLADAWNDWRNEASYRGNLESLQELPFYHDYGNVLDLPGPRPPRSPGVSSRGSESGYYDWSVLHPHLAERTTSKAISGTGSILHDINRNYAIITMAHVIASNNSKPILVQRSINGTLLGSPVSMFFVNSTGRSAGLASHHAFGTASKSSGSRKRDPDSCENFGDESGDIYASNDQLCAGGGTNSLNGITGVYYGMDFYGAQSQWEEYDADVGGQYPSSNGVWSFASDLSNDIQKNQWWRACLCDQESGKYSWTGALQYTWNGGFNGYNDCYSGVCGGAS